MHPKGFTVAFSGAGWEVVSLTDLREHLTDLSPSPNRNTHIVLGFQSQCFGIRLFHHSSGRPTGGMDSESGSAVESPPCPPSGSGYMAPDDLDSRGALFPSLALRYQRKQKTPTFSPR